MVFAVRPASRLTKGWPRSSPWGANRVHLGNAGLGIFLSIWLLAAAAAAYYTKVKMAFYAQGGLGIVLLIASLATRR